MATTTDAPLLERDDDLAVLYGVLDEARDGSGRLVVIEGVAGAGKSSLATATMDHAAHHGMRVLRAAGSELERGFAFGAVRQLLEPVLVSAAPDERARLLAGAAAPAAWVAEPLDGGDARLGAELVALHAVYWFAANLADAAPLLLVVDDVHWVDESSLQCLMYLALRLRDLPIAMVIAARPDEPGAAAGLIDELRGQAGGALVRPRPLTAHGVSEVVRTRLGEADEVMCAAFHEASAGNPLYLEELLRTIALEHPGSAAAVREASIPTLGDRVVRRVARVAPEAPALAMAMALLGDGGALSIAARLAGLDEAIASPIAHRLVRIDVLRSEDPFTFVHPLVRRSLYDAMPVVERDADHASAADLLRESGAPIETVAFHLGGLRPAASSMVATTMLQAAQTASARASPPVAIRALRRALEEGAPHPPRADLLFALGEAEMAVRDLAAVDHFSEALAAEPNPARRARIAAALIELLQASGQWDAGVRTMSAIADELSGADTDVLMELEAIRAMTMANTPRLVDAFDQEREHFEALAQRNGWPAAAISATLGAVAAHRGEMTRDPVGLAERSITGGVLSRNVGGWAAAQVLATLAIAGQLDRASEVSEQIAATGRASGSLGGLFTGTGFQGFIYATRGDLVEAEARLRPSLDIAHENGMHLWFAVGAFYCVDAIIERPTLDDVAVLLEDLDAQPGVANTSAGTMMLEARGRIRRMRGDRRGAVSDLRRSVQMNRALKFGPTYSRARSELALTLSTDAHEEARALIDEELALADAAGLDGPIGIALRAAGTLNGGAAGLEQLRESVAVLESSHARLERARSLIALGAALRRANRRADAREPLTAGMELAHQCGATRLVTHADEELRATGARPRRPVRYGRDALTPSELRVARLVASERSNAEIAQELYISRKTVETHLSHVYAKLGLSGPSARRALGDALGAER
jgi:DNA-binding CsgD family transcriptional regulator